MAGNLSAEELDALLGAYAIDAVSAEEREQIERHLGRNPRARVQVVEFREAAALLAHAGSDAPAHVWDRIAHALEEEPPQLELRHRAVVTRLSRSRVRRAAAVGGIAAAILAIVVLGVQVVHQGRQIENLEVAATGQGVLAAAETASRDPDAQRLVLDSIDGTLRAELVYLPDGSGYLLDDNLRRLPDDRTYQLWALAGERDGVRAISVGVLGPDPRVTAFRVGGGALGFLVTEEAAPGVQSSSNPPLLEGTFAD